MAKTATIWAPLPGVGEVSPDSAGDLVLLETGDALLLESGDNVLLEDNVSCPKSLTVWAGSDT